MKTKESIVEKAKYAMLKGVLVDWLKQPEGSPERARILRVWAHAKMELPRFFGGQQ